MMGYLWRLPHTPPIHKVPLQCVCSHLQGFKGEQRLPTVLVFRFSPHCASSRELAGWWGTRRLCHTAGTQGVSLHSAPSRVCVRMRASGRLFHTVYTHISPRCAFSHGLGGRSDDWRLSHSAHIQRVPPQCAFSCVLEGRRNNRRLSHTLYIYMLSLHYAVSRVCENIEHARKLSHTPDVHRVSLHCVFLHVLEGKRNNCRLSHTTDIYRVSLHYVSSHVFWSIWDNQRLSHTSYTCVFLSIVHAHVFL